VAIVITNFKVIPQKYIFFSKIKQNKNKIKPNNIEKACRGGFQKYIKIKL
jgi:hypothetical protein